MKGLLLICSFFFILFFLAGCGQIKQMNQNMQESNQMLTKNTATVQHSSDVIQKNTEEVARSTSTMRTYLPFVLIIILIAILYPAFTLIKLQRRVVQDIKVLVDRLKK